MQSLIEEIQRAQHEVDQEIARHNAGHGQIGSMMQLERIQAQLETMRSQVESSNLPARRERVRGMGDMIADSWPFDSALGELLLGVEQAYLKK